MTGRPQEDETFRAKSKKEHECYAGTQPEFMERCFSSGPGTSQIPIHANIPDKEGRNVIVTTISRHLLNVYHVLDLVSSSSLHLGTLR